MNENVFAIVDTLKLGFAQKKLLIIALRECATLKDPQGRQLLRNQLPSDLAAAIPTTGPTTDSDLLNTITACLNRPKGLSQFLEVLDFFENGTNQMREVMAVLRDLAGLRGMTREERDQFLACLQGNTLPDDMIALYGVALPLGIPASATDLPGILEHFAQFPRRMQTPPYFPVLVFAGLLAHKLGMNGSRLREWFRAAADRRGLSPDDSAELMRQAEQSLDTSESLYLLIEVFADVTPSQGPCLYHVNAALYGNTPVTVDPLCREGVTEDRIAGELDAFLQRIADALPWIADSLRLEFFVPRAWMCKGVHRWNKTVSPTLKNSLGLEYPVVIRSLERRLPSYKHSWQRWQQKWDHLGQIPPEQMGEGIVWLRQPHEYTPDDLYNHLIEQVQRAGVGLLFMLPPPADGGDILDAALAAGTPVGLWMQESAADYVVKCPEIVTELLRSNAGGLPTRLRDLRRKYRNQPQHWGNHLILLYDNPYRLPALLKEPGK